MRKMRSRWIAGPHPRGDGPVLVSRTDFQLHGLAGLPRAVLAGWRLSRHWPSLEGAVGLWLWVDLGRRRIGSVSVWRDEEALRGFVRLPEHVRIMRAYRGRGILTSGSALTSEPDLWKASRAIPSRG
ncbi:hypothetical protein SAMN05444920_101555 [Nonomuraea solani]|uniref:DUF3291 domain-containing protein n=1 Tax=Nonomuraea solani TaxID=1144553 RepID=A0A1H5ULM4_9ACTN|nr:hypothetical protein [Nonomuraea solani]SEF75328.1 hypothetical protein SAMN05444920_101555 [Nonomuraea solani]